MTVSRGRIELGFDLEDNLRLRTERLDIIPGTGEFRRAEEQDPDKLSQMLEADVPNQWPPELVADQRSPDGAGWWDWYVVKRDGGRRELIGLLGLKGWPDVSGTVQIGCSFLPKFQKRGYGTEAVNEIAQWALSHPHVHTVTADTPTTNLGAAAVLRKLGFREISSDGPELLRFEKSDSKLAARSTG